MSTAMSHTPSHAYAHTTYKHAARRIDLTATTTKPLWRRTYAAVPVRGDGGFGGGIVESRDLVPGTPSCTHERPVHITDGRCLLLPFCIRHYFCIIILLRARCTAVQRENGTAHELCKFCQFSPPRRRPHCIVPVARAYTHTYRNESEWFGFFLHNPRQQRPIGNYYCKDCKILNGLD